MAADCLEVGAKVWPPRNIPRSFERIHAGRLVRRESSSLLVGMAVAVWSAAPTRQRSPLMRPRSGHIARRVMPTTPDDQQRGGEIQRRLAHEVMVPNSRRRCDAEVAHGAVRSSAQQLLYDGRDCDGARLSPRSAQCSVPADRRGCGTAHVGTPRRGRSHACTSHQSARTPTAMSHSMLPSSAPTCISHTEPGRWIQIRRARSSHPSRLPHRRDARRTQARRSAE